MRGVFVIGTDTGVGKTLVTALLAARMSQRKIKIGVMKPLECGSKPPRDAEILWRAAGGVGPIKDWVNPYHFHAPLAPALAARRAGKKVDLLRLDDALKRAKQACNFLLVEGAGGLLVPLLPDDLHFMVENLAIRFRFPILIVGRADLGTLNHTLLTWKRATQVGLETIGIVLNQSTPPLRKDPSLAENAEILRELTGLPVFGALPHCKIKGNFWNNQRLTKKLEPLVNILTE